MLAPHKTGETTADFTGKRVLLAEDNALNAEIAVELLQSIGLKVDWAEDGQKAVEMFEKSAPSSYFAVFMDMQMAWRPPAVSAPVTVPTTMCPSLP